jgi:hypothetical protein
MAGARQASELVSSKRLRKKVRGFINDFSFKEFAEFM